jgi:hypothetical protein
MYAIIKLLDDLRLSLGLAKCAAASIEKEQLRSSRNGSSADGILLGLAKRIAKPL